MQRFKRMMKPRSPRASTSPSSPSSLPAAVPAAVVSHLSATPLTNKKMISEMILIYDGDGTISGEIVYMTKKLLGLGHCSACEITHGSRAEKPEFTELKTTGWTVPLRNIHRNEMDDDLKPVATGHVPCLVAKTDDGEFVILLDSDSLDACHGNVTTFQDKVNKSISNRRLELPPMACAKPDSDSVSVSDSDSDSDDDDEAVVPQ